MKNSIQSLTKNNQTGDLISNYKGLIWVQCKGHRCLAYRDDNGKWINFYTEKPLTGFVKVID